MAYIVSVHVAMVMLFLLFAGPWLCWISFFAPFNLIWFSWVWTFGSVATHVQFLESYFVVSDMQKGTRDATEQVPKKCNSCKAWVNMEVWPLFYIFKHFPFMFYLLVHLVKGTVLIDCFCNNRFNAHLGKKGISGKVVVSYEQETLSVEVCL